MESQRSSGILRITLTHFPFIRIQGETLKYSLICFGPTGTTLQRKEAVSCLGQLPQCLDSVCVVK